MATLNCQLYRLFTTFEFRKISLKICLGGFKILANTKYNLKRSWPKTFKILQKMANVVTDVKGEFQPIILS